MICLICMPAAQGLRPRALGMHIRQITRAHVTTIKCTLINTGGCIQKFGYQAT